MPIRYPNGKVFQETQPSSSQKNSQKKIHQKISYSNRGMTLEEDINVTNNYYLERQIAVIHKKPTPVQIVNVDYPQRSAAVIKEAYFKQASTTDYNGVFKGRYIDFEAKETKNKTSFPLQNFHQHQIDHMKSVASQSGICFVILRFAATDEVYLLDAGHLFNFWERSQNGGRKSISKDEIEQKGYRIPIGFQPRIDYISVIETIYF